MEICLSDSTSYGSDRYRRQCALTLTLTLTPPHLSPIISRLSSLTYHLSPITYHLLYHLYPHPHPHPLTLTLTLTQVVANARVAQADGVYRRERALSEVIE